MFNPYQNQLAKIVEIKEEAINIKRFKLEPDYKIDYQPGQIVFLSISGFGEAPFAPCGDNKTNYLELCIRKAGRVTAKLHSMRIGDKVGIRGPYGQGWLQKILNSKSEKQNLLIVVGGLGLIPLRTLIINKNKYLAPETKIQIFYGAKTPEEFLFKDDFEAWKEHGIDIKLTVDKEYPDWNGCVGVVTKLFDEYPIIENAVALLCGPPMMYKFVLEKIKEKNISGTIKPSINDEDIYLSLERRMHCGIGICQHCAIGSFYTCKDGPVFRYSEVKNVQGAL